MSSEQSADLMWRPPAWLSRPDAGLTYTVFARVYALGTLARLGLPDAMSGDWLLIVFLHLLSLIHI